MIDVTSGPDFGPDAPSELGELGDLAMAVRYIEAATELVTVARRPALRADVDDLAAAVRRLRAAVRIVVPTCGWCGGPLQPGARVDARYCGDRCRQAAHRAAS